MWSTATIISLIACIGACISGIAAAISAILSYKSIKPSLEVEIVRKNGQCLYTNHQQSNGKSFALVAVKICNKSNVAGMIDSFQITYNNATYECEDIFTNFDPYPFEIKNFIDGKYERDVNTLRLKCPLKIDGFSVIYGFFIFPTFPAVQTADALVDIRFRKANSNRIFRIRNVRLSRIIPEIITQASNNKDDNKTNYIDAKTNECDN